MISVSGTPLPVKGIRVGNALGIEIINTTAIIGGYNQEIEYNGGRAAIIFNKQ
ncbi:hypothetical protein [Segetibacter sp. 3557_3]|uniref:hypothetical protein n=1 Tax=Segetibacter sp. 3557_3 TaxID=2547429 RepID=UPI001404EB7A|nr:hypothetical protein [Segetibacter sp. 3557_3]